MRQQPKWKEWQQLERHITPAVTVLDIVNYQIAQGKLIDLNAPLLLKLKSFSDFIKRFWYKIKTSSKRKKLNMLIGRVNHNYVKPAELIQKITQTEAENKKARVNWLAYLYDYYVGKGYPYTLNEFLQLRWDSLDEMRLAAEVRVGRDAAYWVDIFHLTPEGAARLSKYPRRKVHITNEEYQKDLEFRMNSFFNN